jgi:hypothetical protein
MKPLIDRENMQGLVYKIKDFPAEILGILPIRL